MNERLGLLHKVPKRSEEEIIEYMRQSGSNSPPYLQKNLKISYEAAKKISDSLNYERVKIENGCSSKYKLKH